MTVGINSLPHQKLRQAAKKGARFTVMTVGESGLGKTTFINTLFTTTIMEHKNMEKRYEASKTVTEQIANGEHMRTTEVLLEEKAFSLHLTVHDTPGFGNFVNNEKSWEPIVEYIDKQHESYMHQESLSDRTKMNDTRVHACIYFLEPTCHALRPLDITSMQEIGKRVNLIPVIAKADTITPEELSEFKRHILEEFAAHKINVYECPLHHFDEEILERSKEIQAAFPLAIIGSEEEVQVNGKAVRGREYPWGVAEVENDDHCDFNKLRSLLIRTHMLDLIMKTEDFHYENYRTNKVKRNDELDNKLAALEKEHTKNIADLKEHYHGLIKDTTEKLQKKEQELKELNTTREQKLKDLQKEITDLDAACKDLQAELYSPSPSKKKK